MLLLKLEKGIVDVRCKILYVYETSYWGFKLNFNMSRKRVVSHEEKDVCNIVKSEVCYIQNAVSDEYNKTSEISMFLF